MILLLITTAVDYISDTFWLHR